EKTILEELRKNIYDKGSALYISRCPGRVSFSKHADYINSDLLYTLDDRDSYCFLQVITDDQDPAYKKIALYNHGEYESVIYDFQNLDQVAKSHWSFYVVELLRELDLLNRKDFGLTISYISDLPSGAGLSSSHALMLATYKCLEAAFDLHLETFSIIKLCQKVENNRGFNSGLGDQSAQLLGKRNQLSFIKIFPELEVKYVELPSNMSIITAPSFLKADKSLPQFAAANENIKAYKSINDIVKILDCDYLADMNYKYNQIEIFDFLESIQEAKLKHLALYGLAESARVKELKENFSPQKLGEHLNLSHQAESIGFVSSINRQIKIEAHSGYYGASTLANDTIQKIAISCPGVFGSSISGAGLGGSNIIICKKTATEDLKQKLIKEFYEPNNLLEQALEHLHVSSSAGGLSLVS
ncbi:MAG: hypothetical protein LW817_04935, partial [Candidatus Caenarcaniphilales bacterium]|nr:hypothetical protein [Candidatus Caenarcaniphilales bacterium]